MPFVNIKIAKDGATPEKKAELISGVTNLLRDVMARTGDHRRHYRGSGYGQLGIGGRRSRREENRGNNSLAA